MKSYGSLAEALAEHTRPGELYESLPGGRVRCVACGHRCLILDGHDGICRVRFNRGGKLYVPYGYAAAVQCDPIEKKPFFHALPGTLALSFGMLGCNFHCPYCQNWLTSQTLRDPASIAPITRVTPAKLVALARAEGAASVSSTYNEPLITSEWAVAVFREARQAGLATSYVSNGYASPEVIEYLRPWVDFFKVDLKSFQDRAYRQLGGTLQTVLRSIEQLYAAGFWVEIVTLVVPGFNDDDAELRDIANFIAGVSVDIPWHVSAFHPDYRMTDREFTPARTLVRACEIGRAAGLRYVYGGNLPGRLGQWEDTRCPQCNATLIQRRGFTVLTNRLGAEGTCPDCGQKIAGRWSLATASTRAAV